MKKEEALKQYENGLEKTLNHPILLEDRMLKNMMKYICMTAFELGWEVSTFDTKSKEEQKVLLKKWKEKSEKVIGYDGFISVVTEKK